MTIMLNDYQKWEINGNMVNFFELLGGNWVALEPAECWSDELIQDLIDGNGYIDEIEIAPPYIAANEDCKNV